MERQNGEANEPEIVILELENLFHNKKAAKGCFFISLFGIYIRLSVHRN